MEQGNINPSSTPYDPPKLTPSSTHYDTPKVKPSSTPYDAPKKSIKLVVIGDSGVGKTSII